MCKLSDNELWEKCKNGGSITAQDLGLNNLNSDESTYWTEGVFMKDNIYIVPIQNNKPVKIVCENKKVEVVDKNILVVKEKISVEELIRRVKAANEDPYIVLDKLFTDGYCNDVKMA